MNRMKTVNCDICGNEVKECNVAAENKDVWAKWISKYVGRKHDDKNMDFCNFCYLRVLVFVELLREAGGNLGFMINVRHNGPLEDEIDAEVKKRLSSRNFLIR